MAIVFHCSGCNHVLRVPEDVAGKRIKCPQCHEVLRIPDASDEHVEAATPAQQPQAVGAEPLLQLKTPDGNVYGPVVRSEMDRWLAEGRITAQCELLDEAGEHLRWASEVYPQLSVVATPPPPPPTGGAGQAAPVTVVSVAPALAAPTSASPWPPTPTVETPSRTQRSKTETAMPSYRPRIYPAMLLTSRFYRALGWLLIFAAGFAACAVIVLVVLAWGTAEEGTGSNEMLLLAIPGLLVGAIYVAAMVITLWFAAEAIKCLLDIEDNSHRCSHYLENFTRPGGETMDPASGWRRENV